MPDGHSAVHGHLPLLAVMKENEHGRRRTNHLLARDYWSSIHKQLHSNRLAVRTRGPEGHRQGQNEGEGDARETSGALTGDGVMPRGERNLRSYIAVTSKLRGQEIYRLLCPRHQYFRTVTLHVTYRAADLGCNF